MTDSVCTVTDALDRRTTCLDFSVYQDSTDSALFRNVICLFVFVQDLRFPVLNLISFHVFCHHGPLMMLSRVV